MLPFLDRVITLWTMLSIDSITVTVVVLLVLLFFRKDQNFWRRLNCYHDPQKIDVSWSIILKWAIQKANVFERSSEVPVKSFVRTDHTLFRMECAAVKLIYLICFIFCRYDYFTSQNWSHNNKVFRYWDGYFTGQLPELFLSWCFNRVLNQLKDWTHTSFNGLKMKLELITADIT